MIIRSWRACAGSEEVLSAYADHVRRTTFVEMAELPGHLGATLVRKVGSSNAELLVLSFWKDMASAAHFMKGQPDDAVVKESTQKLLQSFDLKVDYLETIVSTGVLEGHD
jgi:heme-degrading monooxygenase HmoA